MTNDTDTLTLSDFLLTRIAQDEAGASAAIGRNGARWTATDLRHSGWRIRGTESEGHPHFAYGGDVFELWDDEGAMGMWPETAEHVARHDPARVLAECEAKRRIVEEHPDADPTGALYGPPAFCDTCSTEEHIVEMPCPTLRALALPYADHPVYRDEWRL